MKSLYTKFVLMTIGIMLFSGMLAFFLSNIYYQQKLKPYNDHKTTVIAESIATYTDEHPTLDLQEYLENIASIGYQIYLVEQTGEASFFGAPFRNEQLARSAQEYVLNGNVYHGILYFPRETFVTGFFANELNNTIGVPLTHNGQQYALFLRPNLKLLFNEMHLLFAALLGLTILLSIIFVIISTKFLVKPISKLTTATTSLANGHFDIQLDDNRQDELGELSRSFLQMAKKLERVEDTRKEFISNISHDIQSPLSNIKGYTTLLENDSLSHIERKQYIAIINGEIKRLSTLTKQLLLLASFDRNEEIMKKKRFNVGKQLKELVQSYQWIIGEKGIMLSYNLPDLDINGDPSLLNTVWDNLLTNAIKYNQSDGTIDITVEQCTESIVVTFEDTGIGLSRTEIDRMFERFYRADTSRTRTVEGTGLGLSIVSTIVRLHEGKIHVDSKENEGTTIRVELPV
ncbi:HAMP domain-containing sensor histidine kinase [Lysinibacillus sp. KU-BSD001]|uniref:sensor histidine kinase n=1 Tax=Lysinibacillus sp. KU-BSD001 TaxID=3141328 RepID=UPI0036E68C8C